MRETLDGRLEEIFQPRPREVAEDADLPVSVREMRRWANLALGGLVRTYSDAPSLRVASGRPWSATSGNRASRRA